jgi:FtsZ-interacting cell division protein YlmF
MEYTRASQPSRAAAPAPAYRNDPIRDEFERLEQPQPRVGNVITMQNDSRHQTVIYYLHTLEECRDVISDLIDNKTVLLNLEEMEEKTIQRGIDTLCGAAFALGATLRKASDKTYLIAPNNVEVAMTNETERRY